MQTFIITRFVFPDHSTPCSIAIDYIAVCSKSVLCMKISPTFMRYVNFGWRNQTRLLN
jgi:hypothetical protein